MEFILIAAETNPDNLPPFLLPYLLFLSSCLSFLVTSLHNFMFFFFHFAHASQLLTVTFCGRCLCYSLQRPLWFPLWATAYEQNFAFCPSIPLKHKNWSMCVEVWTPEAVCHLGGGETGTAFECLLFHLLAMGS